jgi:hypothetical protein
MNPIDTSWMFIHRAAVNVRGVRLQWYITDVRLRRSAAALAADRGRRPHSRLLSLIALAARRRKPARGRQPYFSTK